MPADELHRALRFAYTTWYSYGAKGEHFAAVSLKEAVKGDGRRPLNAVRDLLVRTAERLARVRIEQRDFAALITRFDTPETFFYLDPPYVHFGANGRYDALPAARRVELFQLLAGVRGTFLLSFDACAEVRELAAAHGMHVEDVQTSYGLGHTRASRRPVTEVLVTRATTGEGGKPAGPNKDGSFLDLGGCG